MIMSPADQLEVARLKRYLADPRRKSSPGAAYAEHFGEVVFVATEQGNEPAQDSRSAVHHES